MANIDISNLEPNSHAYKAEKAKRELDAQNKEKVKPVIRQDQIVSTKKPLSKKFAETFMTEDAKDVKTWLIMDVLIPGLKSTILDVISMMFFGETDSRSRGSSRDRGGRTNYRAKYRSSSDRDDRRRRDDRYDSDDRVDFRNIVLRNRADGEDLVNEMKKRIEDTGSVSISELLDMIDAAASSRYTDCNWGWDDPRDVGLRRISSGWLIDVAEPRYLN